MQTKFKQREPLLFREPESCFELSGGAHSSMTVVRAWQALDHVVTIIIRATYRHD
jgi:hypothetical protein